MLETIREKIAYLRGMVDGDSSLEDSRNGFLFGKILQILEELAREVDNLKLAQDELDEYLQEVDFDLAYLEDEFFSDEYDDELDEWEEDYEGSLAEVECPDCGDLVTFDEDFLFDEGVQIRCPRCDGIVFETDDFEDLDEIFSEDTDADEIED